MKFGNLTLNPTKIVGFKKEQTYWGDRNPHNNFFISCILTKEAQEGLNTDIKPSICFYGTKYSNDQETQIARDKVFNELTETLNQLYLETQTRAAVEIWKLQQPVASSGDQNEQD
jgi:hypothetical protein